MAIKYPVKSVSKIFAILRKNKYLEDNIYVDDSTMEECCNALK